MFFNALEIEKMEKNHYLFYEPGNEIPYAVETYRIKGNFRENLELWDFPLDYQVFYFNLFTLCNCFITLSIKLELSLLGECFCVSLPSALNYSTSQQKFTTKGIQRHVCDLWIGRFKSI